MVRKLSLTALVLLILSCNLPVATATPPPISEPTSTAESSQPTDPNEVIIPATTKVMDTESLSSLESVDPDGTLHFTQSRPTLTALQPADVLVSDASKTAPFGLLKKIISIRTEGERVIITTEDALITDAVHQGSGSVTRELKPEDIRSSQILQAGVTFEGYETSSQPFKNRLMNPTSSEDLRPAGLTYSFNTDLGTSGQVQVTGTATINPIMDFGLNISCDETVKIPLVGRGCKEIPDLNVLAKVGIKENANLVIKGKSSYTFNQNYQIARHEFSPITFALGPVSLPAFPFSSS